MRASNFRRTEKEFSIKPAVQRQKIRENKTHTDAKKGFPVFLALLGRFGVRGIETPELLLLLVTKEGGNLSQR